MSTTKGRALDGFNSVLLNTKTRYSNFISNEENSSVMKNEPKKTPEIMVKNLNFFTRLSSRTQKKENN